MADWKTVLDEAIVACDGNQAELGRQIERSASVVGNWRTGRHTPDFESCLRLARITGHRADEMLASAGHDPSLLQVADPEAVVALGDAIDRNIKARMRQFESIVASYPRALRVPVIEANIRMVEAFRELTPPPVSAPPQGGVSASDSAPTRGDDGPDRRLMADSRGLCELGVAAAA